MDKKPSGLHRSGIKRLECLDGLRGVLAVYVLLGHMAPFAALPWWVQDTLSHGGAAVDMFFILSGLVITQSLLRTNGQAKPFLIARAIRIFPIFLPAFALAIVVEPWSCGFDHMPWIGIDDPAHSICVTTWPRAWLLEIIAHLTMTHGLFPNGIMKHVWVSFLGSAWSLSTEWQFYLLALLAVMGCRQILRRRGFYNATASDSGGGGDRRGLSYWPKPPVRLVRGRTQSPFTARFGMTQIGTEQAEMARAGIVGVDAKCLGDRAGFQNIIQPHTLCWLLLGLAVSSVAWRLTVPEAWQFSRAFLPNKGHFFALGVASLPVARRERGAFFHYCVVLAATLAICATQDAVGKMLPPLVWTICLVAQLLPERADSRLGVLRPVGWVLRSRTAQYLGAISYCLYLDNEPIHKLMIAALSDLADGDATLFTLLWVPAAVALPIVAAAWLHTHVEVPASRWGHATADGQAADGRRAPSVQAGGRAL